MSNVWPQISNVSSATQLNPTSFRYTSIASTAAPGSAPTTATAHSRAQTPNTLNIPAHPHTTSAALLKEPIYLQTRNVRAQPEGGGP